MTAKGSGRLTRCLLGVMVASALLTASGCGCGRRGSRYGTAEQLRQTRIMFSRDEKGRTCYIVAEVENTGKLPIPRAKVTATVKSGTGKPRGINNHVLQDMKPGERRTFSMTVSAHDSFQHVDLSFSDPEGG
jgi:hypothetical protein